LVAVSAGEAAALVAVSAGEAAARVAVSAGEAAALVAVSAGEAAARVAVSAGEAAERVAERAAAVILEPLLLAPSLVFFEARRAFLAAARLLIRDFFCISIPHTLNLNFFEPQSG
jgi:hypothetical protein